jgi:branched-chain amino acid transport system permease protein
MLAIQVMNGLMEGISLFLLASGLTLVFGVTRIINFAHGSFYMLGAFLTYELAPYFLSSSLAGFLGAVLGAALIVAILGVIFEATVLRKIYHADSLMQLIITVGLVLIIRDVVKTIWGLNSVVISVPDILQGAVRFGGVVLPVFPLSVLVIGFIVIAAMVIVLHFTRIGVILRAATDDREMLGLLGINQRIVFSAVFGVGAFLAGLAGGISAPYGEVNYLLDTGVIVSAFIVCVIGGLGNLYGALIGALVIGITKSLGVMYFPRLSMVIVFLIMAFVLLSRSFFIKGATTR